MGDVFRTKSTFDADLFCSVAGHGMKICGSGNKSGPSSDICECSAIEVRNAYKSFGAGPILEDLNMTVETGSIYSLLGSSGCGKTSLLHCCVGLQKLDRGSVKVFGSPPGVRNGVPGVKVGYMPQELSLYLEFSIEESLRYFGRLYGLSQETILESMNSILKLLDLPSGKRRICTLSGGQKRRVSFAIATFHRPPLLILDEPTVGVDPLLRESIWSFLRHLVASQRTTVIITTHYHEEARQSSTVGVMRHGRLLVEKSPQELMNQYKLPLLEQIVLTLCQNDDKLGSPTECPERKSFWNICCSTKGSDGDKHDLENQKKHHRSKIYSIQQNEILPNSKSGKDSNSSTSTQEFKHETSCSSQVVKNVSSSVQRIKALTFKNFVVLIRSAWFLFFIFIVPAVQIILICLAIGPDPKDLGFGVINDEMYYENDTSIARRALCPPAEGCGVALSCRYLAMLPNTSISLKAYSNVEDAVTDIRGGKIWGYIRFPTNYSLYLIDRGGNPAFALDETYDGSKITFDMDMSNQQIGHNLKKIFIEVYYKFLYQVAIDCALNPRQVELPLHFKPPIYGSDGTSFSEFLAPSVFLGLLFFFPLCSSGISYISEKKSGTLCRSLVAGVTTGEIMVAFLISQLAVLFVQSGLAFVILNVVFKIPILGSVPLGLTLAVLVGVGGMSMGFLISTICKEEIHAVLLAIGSFFPNFLLAGMVWPIQGMPIVLQYIAYLLPCTLACESMRSIVSRGWSWKHPSVWPGFVSTIGWIFVYWFLTIVLQRCKSRK